MEETSLTNDRFLGSWSLQGFTATASGEVTHLLGKRPSGLLSYTADGAMSAHLVADPACAGLTMAPYTAYFGSFVVDAVKSVVRHQVHAATEPSLTGTIQERAYRFETDDRLILSATVNGRTMELLWGRGIEEQQ